MAWNKKVNTKAPSKSVIANLLKAGVALSLMLLFSACGGDSSNNSGTDENSTSSTDVHSEENDPSSYTPEAIVPVKNKTITGLAQKGPFKSGSTVDIFELELDGKTFAQTGKSFTGKVSNDNGAFKISNVSLKSQYALLRVTGYFTSEINGESVHATLTAVTDLSKRENVNVNILTHLEYDRVLYLLGKGMNFTAAKKQAEREVLAAFGIEGKFKNSEDLDVFGDSDADAALVAISKLLLAGEKENSNRDEEDLSGLLAEIATDIEEDGEWSKKLYTSLFEKRGWLDNAGDDDYIGGWPETCSIHSASNAVEKFIRHHLVSQYYVGVFCASAFDGELIRGKRGDRYNYSNLYLCKDGEWIFAGRLAGDDASFIRDTLVFDTINGIFNYMDKYKGGANVDWCKDYLEMEVSELAKGKDGEIKKGPKTGTLYKYDENYKKCQVTYSSYYDWEIVREEDFCSGKRGWRFGETGWRIADDLDTLFGACTVKHNGEIQKDKDSSFYCCDNGNWRDATVLEKDTYKWVDAKEGEFRKSEKTGRLYRYESKTGGWRIATDFEKDVYGLFCTKDGKIVSGAIDENNKYVCDADTFRVVNVADSLYDFACVSYTEGKTSGNLVCQNGEFVWNGTYGSLKDDRDGKTYKTLSIGSQVWMAENLNFEYRIYSAEMGDSVSYGNRCCNYCADSCKTYGRYYTWAAAMDSVGVYSSNGKGCGYEVECNPTYPVRGICPEGWHLPETGEWEKIYRAMGERPYAMQAKGYEEWSGATDLYGFSALYVYDGYGHNHGIHFWCSVQLESGYDGLGGYFKTNYDRAYTWDLEADDAGISVGNSYKSIAFSVRCLKDSE